MRMATIPSLMAMVTQAADKHICGYPGCEFLGKDHRGVAVHRSKTKHYRSTFLELDTVSEGSLSTRVHFLKLR